MSACACTYVHIHKHTCFHTTGQVGWGIAWYINGTLIPELIVERGKTYTFIVEGGTDPDDLSNYHPLYITDSIGGGRLENTQQERDVSPIKHCYHFHILASQYCYPIHHTRMRRFLLDLMKKAVKWEVRTLINVITIMAL